MPLNTSNRNDLALLALVASDAAYAGDQLWKDRVLQPYLEDVTWASLNTALADEVQSAGFKFVKGWSIADTGLKAQIYRNTASNELIVAFAGTDGLNASDWYANLFYMGWNQWSKFQPFLRAALDEQLAAMPGGRVHFTGQSLGGALQAALNDPQYAELEPGLRDALAIVETAGQRAVIRPGRGSNPFDGSVGGRGA